MARLKVVGAMRWVRLTLADEPVGTEGRALYYIVYWARLWRHRSLGCNEHALDESLDVSAGRCGGRVAVFMASLVAITGGG
ncbi:MAG: hypothetical protein ACREC9_07940 [Methylocella sp.]